MPISTITRNSLVYANNKTQNIESRIFGFPTQQSGSIALSYNSYNNKFTADRSTQNSTLQSRYYVSESIASIAYLGYQNDRAVYLENTANPFVIEYSSTSSLLTDTGSNDVSFVTRYYISESKVDVTYLGYQNDRAIYLENTANPFVIEYSSTSSLLTDTGSNDVSFVTRYYISESKVDVTYLGYQNDRAIYLENTANPFVIEYSSTSSLLTDSGSNALSLVTRYYISESIAASSSFLGYQNDRSIYLENLTDVFVLEP